MALPHWNRNGPGLHALRDVSRQFYFTRTRLELEQVIFFDSKSFGVARMDFKPVIPDDLTERIRHFLQPGPIGHSPVIISTRRIRNERKTFCLADKGRRVKAFLKHVWIQSNRFRGRSLKTSPLAH